LSLAAEDTVASCVIGVGLTAWAAETEIVSAAKIAIPMLFFMCYPFSRQDMTVTFCI
jgi:hypothetical protein